MSGGISGTITYLVSPTEPLSVLVILAWTTAISAAIVGFGPQVEPAADGTLGVTGEGLYDSSGTPFVRDQHPQAVLALVLGIFGLAPLTWLLAPFAWSIGNRAMRDIKAHPERFSGAGAANAGRVLGIIGTVLGLLFLVWLIYLLVLGYSLSQTFAETDNST